MKITVSQYIARFFKARGIDTVFELSGGMIMQLLDTLHQEGGIDIVNVYHEQAAAFAADAQGRLGGRPGVALGTSGPGALNLLTGVGSSFFDSSPTLFITGQVNRHEQKGRKRVRQLGFQETDIVALVHPITKFAERLVDPQQILDLLPRAYGIASDGRPGSVLLDIPMDVFRASIEVSDEAYQSPPASAAVFIKADVKKELEILWSAIEQAKRPLILAGNGIHASGCEGSLLHFCEGAGIPVVTSLLGCDLLPYSHPLRCGLIGTYGNRWSNLALSECDLLLVLGSRLDIRQTGADTASFKGERDIFHVDVEDCEMNNRVVGCHTLSLELNTFFCAIEDKLSSLASQLSRPQWLEHIAALRAEWPDTSELNQIDGINPNVFMHRLSHKREVGAFCVDVGLHQMWAAQSLEIMDKSRFLTSGGMGAMGFALPAGIGAAFYFDKQKPIVVIAGDAGFQLNIQELQSVAHHKLPIKIVVLNNRCHGMTRQFQDTYFAGRYAGTVWGYSAPDFVAVANGYGLQSRCIETMEQIDQALAWLWADPMEPCLLEVRIDLKTNAYPKLAFGKPISEMEPFAKPMEMEGT